MARQELTQRQMQSIMDHPELAKGFQDILTSLRQEESAKFQGDAYAGESPPINKAEAQQSAAELLLKLSEAESKWAKSQQNPNKYALLEAYLGFMGTMSGIEERGQTDITGKKVTGDYALLQDRTSQLKELETQRNTKIPAAARSRLITASSSWADGDEGEFSDVFQDEVALAPQEQQAERLSFLAQRMGTSTDAVLAAAEKAGVGKQGVAGTEREIGLEGLSKDAQDILDRETGLIEDVNALLGKVETSGGGLGSRGRAWADSMTQGFSAIMEGGDPNQIAELMGLGAQGVPENATHSDIRTIANDMVDFTDEGFQRVLATTHKRDLLYGDSEASRQFREVAEARGYGNIDPEVAYQHLASEYMAEVGDTRINADVNFAYNVLRGGQAASLGDKIKATAIMARHPGLYADVRRAREGGSEAEARENTARTVEQRQAGESPQEAAQEESERPEGEPVADENRLAEMRNRTAGRLAGEETGEAAEAPAEAGPSQAVRESLQRSADAHGNAISIPGVEGGMIIPGGGGKVHVPGPDGELIPYTPPVAGRQQATEEDLRIAHEKNFGTAPAATLPEGAVSKSSEGWADYHLYADGTIRFIHPETGEMVTVSETSDPESYSAIKQKAFGEAPTADPTDVYGDPMQSDTATGEDVVPSAAPTEGPGGLDDDLFATLGEAPIEESPLTFEDQFPTSEQDPRMAPLDAGDVFADRPDNPNIISSDARKNLPGANLGPMGGLAGASKRPAEEAAATVEEKFEQTPYPEGMEDLPQSDYPEGAYLASPDALAGSGALVGESGSVPGTSTATSRYLSSPDALAGSGAMLPDSGTIAGAPKSTPAARNAALQASMADQKEQRGVTQAEADAANPTPEDLARRDEMHAEHGEFKGSQQRPLGEEDLGETPLSEETSGTAETTASAQRPEELDYPRAPTDEEYDAEAEATGSAFTVRGGEEVLRMPQETMDPEDEMAAVGGEIGSSMDPTQGGLRGGSTAPGMTASESQATGIPTPPKPPVSPAAKAASPSNLSGGASTEEKATSPVGRYNKAIMESDSMKLAQKMQPAP